MLPTLRRSLTSCSWICHKVLKVGHSCILSIGLVSFTLTMACSALMVYLPMAKLFIQSGVGEIFLDLILDIPV